MTWEAANVSKAGDLAASEGAIVAAGRQPHGRSRSTETVEAALSRLSKAYNTSMECIGAMHKTDEMILRRRDRQDDHQPSASGSHVNVDPAVAAVRRVANAARMTLESSILLDPLIIPHAPILHQCMVDLSEAHSASSVSCGRWGAVQDRRPVPPAVSSAAHKSTLIQLAYLSLVNYSDLLQSSCPCYSTSQYCNTTTILDRGIVPKHESLLQQSSTAATAERMQVDDDSVPSCRWCCWKPEIPEETHRLAVAALCDASNLRYASDPILWLKLGCASRCLERIVAARDDTTVVRSHHRRLQRHALERGSVALPSHMPPNRTVLRALRELLEEPDPQEYISKDSKKEQAVSKTLELPRYSWAVLGRMLLRASRGEDESTQSFSSQKQKLTNNMASLFGSPRIDLKLSPMLVFPQRVLGKICQYLDNPSIWKLEATCRALAVSLVAARASMQELDEGQESKTLKKPKGPSSETETREQDPGRNVSLGGTSRSSSISGVGEESKSNAPEDVVGSATNPPPVPARQSSRSSKRLLSQQISSEKKQDREKNRHSFDYCYLAATLSCTVDEHDDMVKRIRGEKKLAHLYEGTDHAAMHSGGHLQPFRLDYSSEVVKGHIFEARERISDSSLQAFVQRWSLKNSGPMDMLERFLVHVSIHVEDVFSSDPGAAGTMGLASCIITCFEQLLFKTGSNQSILPRFYKPVATTSSLQRSLECFAMDLLYAELILRECDRNTPEVVEFDDDENLISLMVPALTAACSELGGIIGADTTAPTDLQKSFNILKARCLWLGAGFYLWRSRIASEIYVSRDAEDEGTLFLDEAIKSFDSAALTCVKSIQTPQLVSPGRLEPHWKELSSASLSKFRDELQASSVVSAAKQLFQELVSQLHPFAESEGQFNPLSEENARALAAIGQKLLGRYNTTHGCVDSKLPELVDNFISMHGGLFLTPSFLTEETKEGETPESLKFLLPLSPVDIETLQRITNPSTLSMLFVCLTVDPNADNRNFLVRLVIHLIHTTIDMHDLLVTELSRTKALARQASSGYNTDEVSSDSEDDSEMSVDRGMDGGPKKGNEIKTMMCGKMVKFLLSTLTTDIQTILQEEEQSALVASDEFAKLLDVALSFSNKWYQSTVKTLSIPEDSTDCQLFLSIARIVDIAQDGGKTLNEVEAVFFKGMVRIVTSHGILLQQYVSRRQNDRSDGFSRSSRQRSCIQRVEFICMVASKLGLILSTNLAHVENYKLVKGSLFGESSPRRLSREEETLFADVVRWLWKFSSRKYEETTNNTEVVCPSFERPMVRRLRIPISTLIVGLCGSASASRGTTEKGEDPLGLKEFFDSDTSVTDWQSDTEDADLDDTEYRKKELLRVICHSVHCIGNTLDKVNDKDSVKHFLEIDCDKKKGARLPLVCTRVLNFFADALLLNFGTTETTSSRRQLLWSDEYPYRTQDEGEFLDSILHKAYRWMYGFVLVGEWDHVQNSGGKDLAHALSSIYEISKCGFRPESTAAAAQLYRCIIRAYATGRRTPPKASLELVSSALPPMRESERSSAIRAFIFSPSNASFSLEKVERLVKRDLNWDASFAEARESLLSRNDPYEETDISSEEIEAMQVRRGISARLASGPLPVPSSDLGQNSDASVDDRMIANRSEKEIKKKFNAILDDICLRGADCEGWYRAAQCLNMKADVIADRLGLTLGFGRVDNFSVSAQRKRQIGVVDMKTLLEEQQREEESAAKNHVAFLGCQLSVFVNYAWSSYSSLQECSQKVMEELVHSTALSLQERSISIAVLKKIDSDRQNGDFLAWQEAWGGIYVLALRHLALRFMSVALFLLHSKLEKGAVDDVLTSEICEAIGVALYSELMASQRYGWPMDRMTPVRKRQLASAAKECFQASAKLVENSSGKDDDSEGKATWDLLFMVGKCEEKVAWTYQRESYTNRTYGDTPTRLYERHMAAALKQYADALQQAKKIEDDGRQLADQAGGSAHGSVEVLYRLHATRLKCLIHAVSRNKDELEFSELEALRLAESYWFGKEAQKPSSGDVRDRVWNVFADVVEGLAECRQAQPFFHRSVYRHAQALMWSPVLNDPLSGVGSMNTVPATRSFAIRGLNNSTPAAVSASVIMSKLFDKKRTQLCAVWVTTNATSSPFQVLNTAIRKYDSLRGKYIAAYLEAMHLCSRKTEIETFEKWLYATKRDLPSYFQASALNGGGRPAKPHSHDSLLLTPKNRRSLSSTGLLTTAKRASNSFLAHLLVQEMTDKLGNTASKPSADVKKVAESYLKHAYACYLRLNCSTDDLRKTRAFKYGGESIHEVEALCQAYLQFGGADEVSTTDFGDWSGGSGRKSAIFDAALEKCKALFPSLSGTFFSKKGSTTAKSRRDAAGGVKRKDAPVDLASPTSPSSEGTKKISFEVNVPKGLTTGDTFLTQVKVGDGDPIKVKLTVPANNPKTLRFNLDVPKLSHRKITKKAKMSL